MFEVIYKILLTVMAQFGESMIIYALEAADVNYLTNQNILEVLKHPVSLISLLAFFILFIYVSFVEIAAIILYCDCASEGRKTGVRWLLLHSLKRALAIFQPKNLGMSIVVLLLMPLTGIVFVSGPLGSLKIPGFILEFIKGQPLLGFAYFGITLLFLFYFLRWIFSIPEFVLHPCSFKEARIKSVKLGKRKRIRIFLFVLIGSLFIHVMALGSKAIYVLSLLFWTKFTAGPGEAEYAFWFYYYRQSAVGTILFASVQAVFLISVVMAAYYKYQGITIDTVKRKGTWRKKAYKCLQVLASFFCVTLYAEMIYPLQNDIFKNENIQIVAHRAGAVFAPENTLAALKEAIRSGADAAEIDVQQTKDGVLVVMHDTDFKRIAGVSQKIWDVTYEECRRYDIGKHLMQGFEGEYLPTLEDMLKEADGKINLMIELKSSGHEQKLEEKTVELIRRYHFESQCTVASMDYSILERVKELDPHLKTVYIAALAYGDMTELNAADAFSIEETFITPQLLAQASVLDKEVYAWTINDEKSMKRMIKMQVNGIITDNTYYTSYILNTKGQSEWVMDLAEKVL
ncbi:glycerophosphodiester phosphodiesterase [Lactonifactor longoviformis]